MRTCTHCELSRVVCGPHLRLLCAVGRHAVNIAANGALWQVSGRPFLQPTLNILSTLVYIYSDAHVRPSIVQALHITTGASIVGHWMKKI